MQNVTFDQLKALITLVEHIPPINNHDIVSQWSHLHYIIDKTPYYVIARHKDNSALAFTENVAMLIKSAKSKVPLVFNLYFVDSQMVELELFQADSSSIDDNSFWDNNQNLLYDVTWEFLE